MGYHRRAVRKAIGSLTPVREAADALDEAMAPAPEEIVRGILGALLSISSCHWAAAAWAKFRLGRTK